jgi:hypothetical protein
LTGWHASKRLENIGMPPQSRAGLSSPAAASQLGDYLRHMGRSIQNLLTVTCIIASTRINAQQGFSHDLGNWAQSTVEVAYIVHNEFGPAEETMHIIQVTRKIEELDLMVFV